MAALQYAAAAAHETDPALLLRATEVTAETLQPSLMAGVAARWLIVDPKSLQAQRAAARAALALDKVDEAAAHYRVVVLNSPAGVDAGFVDVETDLGSDENVFGAHQLADRLASYFPSSPSALRIQGIAAMRADDPAAAVHSLSGALAIEATSSNEAKQTAHKELAQTLLRARILAGDVEEPLRAARVAARGGPSPTNRFNYAALLMTAQRCREAAEQLEILSRNPESAAVALRLLGIAGISTGPNDVASAKFRQLQHRQVWRRRIYYLALIADRNGDPERALRFFSQVQNGENVCRHCCEPPAAVQTRRAERGRRTARPS